MLLYVYCTKLFYNFIVEMVLGTLNSLAAYLKEVFMAKKLFFILALLSILAAAFAVEAKDPSVPGIPADFVSYQPMPGEIWVWETGLDHPSLTRCVLGQQEGLYFPADSTSPSNFASCDVEFDLTKYAVAIGGVPVICGAGFNPAEMTINCKKDK